MINTIKTTFKIDFTYAINSFIFHLKKMPIIGNIIPDSLYAKEGFKTFIRILGILCTCFRLIISRFLYFVFLYYIAVFLFHSTDSFLHLYFVFTLMGMFLNTGILNTGRKKYFSVILFQVDAKKFILSQFLLTSFINFIFNTFFLYLCCTILKIPIYFSLILSLFSVFSKAFGEALNVSYYQKFGYRILDDKYICMLVLVIGFILAFLLPLFNIYFLQSLIILFSSIFVLFGIYSYIYLFKVKNYKLIYKKINHHKIVMNSKYAKEYSRQAIINIHEQDKLIHSKKLKNKKGYDLFNTIFFERHKYILYRSANIYMIISILAFLILFLMVRTSSNYSSAIHDFLMNHLGWMVIIMYFMNRGSIVTRAMFFNCDHSMLTFNFYRDKDVILNLFKKRLFTLIKINLRPALVIAIGLPVLLFITGGSSIFLDYINIFIFILSISVFFSVHYLVIYYLLQPYNQNMEMVNQTYSIVSFATYFISYLFTKLNLSSTIFSGFMILFTLLYVVISLVIVYRKAPKTFKLK